MDIEIITETPTIETRLGAYREEIGADYPGYRGHVYRVLSYTMYLLGGASPHRESIETALVYHDIGLWTDRELAYLEPSEARAEADADAAGWAVDRRLVRNIIHWHHKISAFTGPDAEVVDAVRRADWIDATKGRLRKGIPRNAIDAVQATIPAEGFYETLDRLGPELGGSQLGALRKLSRVFKW